MHLKVGDRAARQHVRRRRHTGGRFRREPGARLRHQPWDVVVVA